MKDLTFKEFKTRVTDFWRENLKEMGYELFGVFNGTIRSDCPYYAVNFTQFNPRTNQREYTLNLVYDCGTFEVNETFDDLANIPKEYGDMHEDKNNPEWEQPPMFIYGQYKRFGDALNSLLKGDSINLRPYKELYY